MAIPPLWAAGNVPDGTLDGPRGPPVPNFILLVTADGPLRTENSRELF